jgi:hypothetical protein
MCELARIAVQNQKAGLIALWSWPLRNKFVWKAEVELGCEHVVNIFKIRAV